MLAGKLPGPIADTVALNAGAGLFVAGIAQSIQQGCAMAKSAIEAGTPLATLDKWIACSQAAATI